MKSIIKYIKQHYVPATVIYICIYALYLRILSLYNHVFWFDEIYQLHQMKSSFFDFLTKELPRHEVCPYLSGDLYLIFPFFKIFSYDKWGLAIPHIISTVLGFYLLYLICKRHIKTIWGYLITFIIVCFNATLVYHATEIRVYAVLPTIAMATYYVFQKIGDSHFRMSTPKKIGVIIFFIFVIWFHAFGILIFFSSLLYTLLLRIEEKNFTMYLKNAVSLVITVLIIASPLFLYSVFGSHYRPSTQDGPNITFAYISDPFHDLVGFLKDIFCNLIGFKPFYFLAIGMIIPFLFSYKERYNQLLFLTFIVALPIYLLFWAAVINNVWFLQRQFIWVMPFFAFYLGWTWDSLIVLLNRNMKKEQ